MLWHVKMAKSLIIQTTGSLALYLLDQQINNKLFSQFNSDRLFFVLLNNTIEEELT